MGNRPTKNYDYNRAGVAMVTLKTRPGMWLCRITPDSFTLTDVGRVVQQALGGIHGFYEQVKIGQYQIMPDHLHAMVHVVRDLPDGVSLWGIGNCSLLDHPRRVQVQFSRRTTEEQWKDLQKDLTWYLDQGYVLVSAFISPYEKRVLCEAAAHGGRIIRLINEYFCARYKPAGMLFDMCCDGRLLEISVAGAFARNARLDRAACLRLNEVAETIATTQWSQ